ncbi:MAG: glycosyltransferase [Myxococcota bacterium]
MIPPVAHFIWFGSELPWVSQLALRSARRHGGFERVVLHHDGRLTLAASAEGWARKDDIELETIDPKTLFANAGIEPDAMMELYSSLEAPSARANVVRAAILAGEGGVYLDCDTITIRSLESLRAQGAFCGRERVVYPSTVARSQRLKLAKLRSSVRRLLALTPGGWRVFRQIEGLYPAAENNAVLGAEAGHPFVRGLLRAMVEVPPERRRVRFALGTHLLQEWVATYEGEGLEVHPPFVFYPLGPAISQHWFRLGGAPSLDEVLDERTRIVHWYASVENEALVSGIDEAYVRAHADRQLFSALALRYAL